MKNILFSLCFSLISGLFYCQKPADFSKFETGENVSAQVFLPDLHFKEDSIYIDHNSGSVNTIGAYQNSKIFKNNDEFLNFIKKRDPDISGFRYEIENPINDFIIVMFYVDRDGYITNIDLVKSTENKDANLDISRVFRRFPKIVPPKNKSGKSVRTLGVCRVYIDITPIRRKPIKYATPDKVSMEKLQESTINNNGIPCNLGKE